MGVLCGCRLVAMAVAQVDTCAVLHVCGALSGPRAMEGDKPFHEALDMRLEVMQPTRDGVAEFMATHPISLSPRTCHRRRQRHAICLALKLTVARSTRA